MKAIGGTEKGKGDTHKRDWSPKNKKRKTMGDKSKEEKKKKWKNKKKNQLASGSVGIMECLSSEIRGRVRARNRINRHGLIDRTSMRWRGNEKREGIGGTARHKKMESGCCNEKAGNLSFRRIAGLTSKSCKKV